MRKTIIEINLENTVAICFEAGHYDWTNYKYGMAELYDKLKELSILFTVVTRSNENCWIDYDFYSSVEATVINFHNNMNDPISHELIELKEV